MEQAEDINEDWDIASQEYAELANQSLMHFANLDFDEWEETLADDIEYYFPDGDAATRTVLSGKQAVMDWWENWAQTSGIESMDFTNIVLLPVIARESLNYSGLEGHFVIIYFSNELAFDVGTVNLRMNMAVHFNDSMEIDRFYSYYYRAPILELLTNDPLDMQGD